MDTFIVLLFLTIGMCIFILYFRYEQMGRQVTHARAEKFEGGVNTANAGTLQFNTSNGEITMNNGVIDANNVVNRGTITTPLVDTDNLNAKSIKAQGTVTANTIDVNSLCMNGKCITSGDITTALAKANNGGVNNIALVHPNGSSWKYDSSSDTIKLKRGDTMYMNVYDKPEIYANEKGRIGLMNTATGTFVRHSGFILRCNPLASNNFDFAWLFVQDGVDKYKIYNDYGGGYYIGYDDNSDSVLIVAKGDSRIVTWSTSPRIPGSINSKWYDNTDFQGNDIGVIKASTKEDCMNVCINNSQCKGVTYDPRNGANNCYQKNLMSSSQVLNGVQSWVKERAKPPSIFSGFSGQFNLIKSKNRNNFCMDVWGGSRDLKAPIIGWDCHGGGNQQWKYDEKQRLIAQHSGMCLDVWAGGNSDDTPVIQWQCHDGANQKWLPDDSMRLHPQNAPSKCLTVNGNANGSPFIIRECGGGSDQQLVA